VLDQDTLLLEYSLGEERSYLWAVTPTSITSYELPKRAEIEAAARQVYALLSDQRAAHDVLVALRSGTASRGKPKPGTSPPATQSPKEQAPTPPSPEAATRLSQMLLAPVAAQLGSKRLLIVADGALQYIPFAALPSPTGRSPTTINEQTTSEAYRPLIIEHEIISLPSASTLAVLRQEVKDRKPAAKTVAVLADPVFESDDVRVKPAMKVAAGALSDKSSRPGCERFRPERGGIEHSTSAGHTGGSQTDSRSRAHRRRPTGAGFFRQPADGHESRAVTVSLPAFCYAWLSR
jgi:hypothetical protein